jgi:Tfp pilus assembly protein PilN
VIRTNLSTRPFYNERMIHLGLLLGLVIVIAATLFNITRVIAYSHSDTQLATQAEHDEARAAELRRLAVRQRSSIDPKQIEFASSEAREANDLIDRRTFSWTELFNQFETTLPDDVRITAVRPKADRGQFVLSIAIVARGSDDVSRFMDNLEGTGVFKQVGSRIDEHVTEEGQLEATLQALYTPGALRRDAPAESPAAGGRR